MEESSQLIGASFAGCTVERLLGRGGMGAVYLGRTAAGEPRALKFLAAELAQNPQVRERFEREGLALQKVPPHPNLVRVFGVFHDDLLDQPYIVMEYLDGRSLSALLREGRRLEPAEAARLALGAARGLEALHRCGLIHRDVKPANLQLLESGQVKVVDLGLAKDLFLSGLTEPGRVVGTMHYMAPEQWESAPATEATDVFGLGATLYHLLTGSYPFRGDAAAMREQSLGGRVAAVRERVPEVPPQLEEVVQRMLRPALHERYANMQDVVSDLERALRGQAPTAVPHLVTAQPPHRRWPLVGGRNHAIGSDAAAEVCLRHPSVGPRHARIRRKARGFVLSDLRSAGGTRVGGEPVGDSPRLLTDGDRVRVGEVELVFHDPGSRGQAAYLGDVARATCVAPLLHALCERGDRRVVLWLLEQLAPDPLSLRASRRLLSELLGSSAAEADAEASREEAARRTWAFERLRVVSGRTHGDETASSWLSWWCQTRLEHPVQLAPPAPARAFRLRIVSGAMAREARCGDVTLLGRDPKCQLVLERPSVARLQAMALRLHRRLIVRAEEGLRVAQVATQVAFLDPGVSCELQGVSLELEVDEEAHSPRVAVDRPRFEALVRRRHPATAAAFVDRLELAQRDWAAAALPLFPGDPVSASRVGQRAAELTLREAKAARDMLARVLGHDHGADLGAWQAALTARSDLGVQVLPLA